ncbi:cell division protein SepF [Streptococcus cameli]
MAFKDSFKNFFNYFEVEPSSEYDEQVEAYRLENKEPKMRVATSSSPASENTGKVEYKRSQGSAPILVKEDSQISGMEKLTARQQELSSVNDMPKTTIDIKFPKKYEEAPEIVNLLLENATVLIDFQYMSETQARRCLDYLDGARSVLSGNLKKVSNTMWLLTPVNVTVNIEELRSANKHSDLQFESDSYDLKRY